MRYIKNVRFKAYIELITTSEVQLYQGRNHSWYKQNKKCESKSYILIINFRRHLIDWLVKNNWAVMVQKGGGGGLGVG